MLAAGGGRRYGGPKLLAASRGTSLLRRMVSTALATTGKRTLVVLGAYASRLGAELEGLPVTQVYNRCWREGMGTSLAAGIRSLPFSARAALILPADLFSVDAGDLARLIEAWRRRPTEPAAASFGGRIGAPAILPREWFERLRTLQGDLGARELLRAATDRVSDVPMPHAALDLDRRAQRTVALRSR